MNIRNVFSSSQIHRRTSHGKRAIFYLALLTLAPAYALDSQTLAGLPNVAQPARGVVTTSALQAADIKQAANAGIARVVDLRVDAETPDFDEAKAVRDAGMSYTNLPIRGADDLTRDNVVRFDQLIEQAHQTDTLVHCASGNRVGAMVALRAAWIQNASIDDAIAEGQRWGLGSLEPAVRERLVASMASTPPIAVPDTPVDGLCKEDSTTAASQARGCAQ